MASSSVQRRQRRRLSVNTTANLTLTAAEKVIGDDDLLSRILIRLPAKPLFRFKTVSKRWCSLISDPYVLQRWIPPKSPSSFFLRRYSRFPYDFNFNHVSLNGLVKHNRSIAPLYLYFFDNRHHVIISKSCNGLLLCTSSLPGLYYCNHSHYYVLNPTTQQYSTIPRPVNGDQYDRIVSINLAFDPSLSLHYKIIALISRRDRSPEYRIAVYSSETRTWVNSVPVIYPSDMIIANGVFSNGKIHWLRCRSKTSIAYDIDRDESFPFPMPYSLTKSPAYFGESGGHLLFIESIQNWGDQFDVWELESDYSHWFVKYHVDLEMGALAFPGITYEVEVLCFLGGEVEGDSCLIFYLSCQVISYNFKDRSFRKVCNLKLRPCDIDNIQMRPSAFIHPCMETIFNV
ncbi:F-box protein At5g07610-like [Camellia sinensis]|uniref:Uncharacterized protein n=1 Tax=Camellia sinensis var. sinensis TaxID=542762 RepID=A0A4S4DNF1_CAMSN|nr:F-box protein At5g07610-like [Camellia sinensis]THG04552.1 hypothetical protein TEA_028528 [Camellia sinensis var. sinensis]